MCTSKEPNLMPALSAIVNLKDGRQAVIRPPAPADAGALADFNREAAEDYGRQVPEPDEAVTDPAALEEMLRQDAEPEETDEILLRKERGDRENSPDVSVLDGSAHRARGFLLGAFVGPTLAGTVSLYVVSLRKVSHVGEIGLAVLPVFKGVGLGRALLLAAMSESRRRGLFKLVARVFADNEPAISLYRGLGFIEEGRQVRQYLLRDGTYRDGIWMAKFLG
jgi:ribosomal protein S18 acetylase RimI-like enzyme